MSAICATCSGTPKNTGVSTKVKPFGRTYGMYIVPLVDSSGARNYLDLGAADLDQELLDKVNATDESQRFYPLLNLKNVAPSQADATYETDDTNQRAKVLDGIKTMNFEKWDATHIEFGQLEDVCVDFGIILIDNCGNLLGEWDEDDNYLYPREVNESSYDAQFMDATATTTSKIMIQFDYDIVSTDANQIMLSVDSFTTVNPVKLKGMIDVKLVASNITSTTVDVQVNLIYGTANDLIPFEGAGSGDFTLYNNTTDASVVVGGAVESGVTPGLYTLTFIAQTAADVIEVDVFRAATGNNVNGFEGIETTFVAV